MDKFLETYFIRHKFCVWKSDKKTEDHDRTLAVLLEAWDQRFAVIDYEEIQSQKDAFRPESYKNDAAKRTIRKMNMLLETGGIVSISSNVSHQNSMLVGIVNPKTQGELYSFNAHPGYKFKVIQLEKSIEVSIGNYAGLFSKIPRQTAFTRWPSANKTLNQIIQGIEPRIETVDDLDDSQLEIICYEWLRATGRLEFLTLPIGRTLMSLDIVGVDKNFKKVLSQVTFHSPKSIDSKVKALKTVAGESSCNLYFFCNGEKKKEDGIQFVNIADVFSFFSNTEKGSLFLKNLN